MRHPAAIVAAPLVAGAWASALVPAGADAWLAAALASAWLAGWVAERRDRPRTLGVAAALTAGLAGTLLAADAARGAVAPPLVDAVRGLPGAVGGEVPVRVEGRVLRDAEPGEDAVRLDLHVTRVEVDGRFRPAGGRLRLSVGGVLAQADAPAWRAGRRLRAWALLREPSEYRNAGARRRSAADADRYGALVASVKSGALVELAGRGSVAAETAAAARAAVRRAIGAHVGRSSRRAAAIVTAILIGDRTDLGEDVELALQKAGTYHVIAISGGNLALLAAIVLGALRLAGVAWRLSSVLTIAALAAYAYLVGDEASVARATVVAAVFFGARALDHRTPPLNALAVAAAALVLVRPLVVFDAGFLLSFGATLGILAGAVPVVRGIRERLRARGWRHATIPLVVVGLGAATVSAELALFPVSAYLFFRVTLAGLLLNFLAIPLMAIAQAAGLAVVALARPCGWCADCAGDVAAWAAEGLVQSADLVRWVPWLTWRLPPPPIWVLGAYYAAWGGWFFARTRGGRQVALAAAAAAAVLVLAAPTTLGDPPRRGWLRVTVLDVGQGDATLVQFPGGRSLLVDAGGAPGGRFDLGGRVVAPALWRLGVRRLDHLAISHVDPDHAGGALAIVRDFRPRSVWDGVPVPRDPLRQALASAAEAGGLDWRLVQAGDRVRIGPVDVVAAHPPPPDWERQQVRNDDSLVLDLRWGDVSIVLPGDVGRDVEAEVAARLAPAALRVLKAPHHGSASSSSWALIEAARPSVVVVSAGRGNFYGHPAPAVLARYRAVGAAIFRTDEDGAITVETDGHELVVRTVGGRRLQVSR